VWILLVRAAITGVFGSAFGKWFLSTRMGRWFQTKLNNFMEYLAKKYDINIAKKEAKWASQYPGLANRIEQLEAWSHPPVAPGGTTELMEEIAKLQKEIDALKPKKSNYSSKRKAK
jgi:hypothetical protein